jgi:hypothetical protein
MHRSRRPVVRLVGAVAIAGVAAFTGITPAGAGGTAWNAAPLANVNDTSTAVAVSGGGCVGDDALIVLSEGAGTNTLPGVTNVQFTPDGAGDWNGILNVPAGLTPGEYTLWGQCVNQFNYSFFAFFVTAPVVPAAPAVPVDAVANLTG